MRAVFAGTQVTLVMGDITVQAVEAIVNAANSGLLGGGGVDGAIHRAGGLEFDVACRQIARLRAPLPPGHAVAVTAGRLPAKRVILTVGPVWRGGASGEARILADAYRSSLSVAREERLRTIAFPSISTGAYGYPVDEAAAVALAAVRADLEAHPGSFDEVRFVLFGQSALDAYEAALEALQVTARHGEAATSG
jgi:O-acetyl-ADP-ribose deacetylase (regulator of RNase III)